MLSKPSPDILLAVGIAGMIGTVVLAVSATPKALKLIEEKKKLEGVDDLTPAETFKTSWKCYIPATITGATSIGCLLGARNINARRNAALFTAYKLSETALTEYKDKVVETIGEKKEKLIQDAISKDRVDADPVVNKEIIVTGVGGTRCYDYHSGRYFTSDIDHIKRAVNELNRQMLLNDYVSLNDFYDELGLAHSKVGNDLGWSIDKGYIDISFSSVLDEEGTPCLAISYSIAPRHGYSMYS
jgi:hypothetical protein